MLFYTKSRDEHRIAEGEEAVAFLHGDVVGVQDLFTVCECGDEHDERAFRQVEVCDERIHGLEFVAGIDENIRPCGGFMEIPVFVSQRFQRPAGSCADADDPPACAFGFVDDIRGFPGDHAEFGVHMMLRDIRSLDGTERAEADVQRDIRFLNALVGELVQQLLRKVQTGCRCGGSRRGCGICKNWNWI